MPEPAWVVLGDLAHEAAERVAEVLSAAVERRGVAGVALAGGGTPLGLYRALAAPPIAGHVPWERVHVFWGDERLVGPNDPGSNYRAAHDALLGRVPIPPANIHRIRGELSPDEAAADYAARLRDWAAVHDPDAPHPWPRFDLALLGLGEDGHTASLFPGSPVEAESPVLAVTADYQGRPAGRVTLTPRILNDAARVIFLVAGASKAGAVHDTFHADDPARFPAQRIRPTNGLPPLWLLDRDAAARLTDASPR